MSSSSPFDEFDSSSGEAMSSASLQREKEAREAALRAASAKQSRGLIPSTAAASSSLSAEAKQDATKGGLSSAGSGAFDLGLLVLFPVMIGTLLLFLFFPLIGSKLADLGPVPMT